MNQFRQKSLQRRRRKEAARRIAAVKPEVRDPLKRLRKRWRHADTEERKREVAELRKSCSIRGIAAAIGQPEATVRYYTKPAAAKRPRPIVPPRSPDTPMPVSAAPPPRQEREPSSAANRAAETRPEPRAPQVRPTEMQAPPAPQQPATASAADQQAEQPESVESLRDRLPEVMLDLIQAQLGSPETPLWKAQIKGLGETLKYYGKSAPYQLLRHFPDPITRSELYRLTRPVQCKDKVGLSAAEHGAWVAALGLSVLQGAKRGRSSLSWREIMDRVVEHISPPPASAPPSGYQPRIAYAPNRLNRNRPDRTSGF